MRQPNARNENARRAPGGTFEHNEQRRHFMSDRDAVSSFRDAIRAAGIDPPDEIIADGNIHRFGRHKNSWLIFFGDGCPAGAFGDWSRDLSETWSAKPTTEQTQDERRAHQARMEEVRRQRAADEVQRHTEARAKAGGIWSASTPAVDHPYLHRKRIAAHGLRVYKDALVAPVRDIDGELHSLQFITGDGDKRFLTGGRLAGCMYVIGDLESAQTITVCEGIATGASIFEATGITTVCGFNAGNLETVAKALRQRLPLTKLIVCADDDYRTEGNPGLTKATAAARAAGGLLAVPDFGPDRAEGAKDFNDLACHRPGAVSECIAAAKNPFVSFGSDTDGAFSKIRELPDPLPPVPKLDPELIPRSLRAWVQDQADGLQVPLEFCAVPAIVAAASVIGRQVGIALKQHDRWIERCIIWGAVIGRPSTSKSPALRPAQRMLSRLERDRREAWEREKTDAVLSGAIFEVERSLAKKAAKKLVEEGNKAGAREALKAVGIDGDESPEPRLVVNDATIEKLGEILNGNPRGLIQFRDELAGWLASLDKEGREGDRGFWLECWNGQGPYTCDRIGRGTVRIEAPAVSILGGIQPGKLGEYVRGAVKGGMADDGLLQRFQMAVYPDVPASWHYVDRTPSPVAEAAALSVFERLDRLDPQLIGAEQHPAVDVPYLRLDPDAQGMFIEWFTTLMQRLRSGGEPPFMEAHLAKYPALVGRLALTLHLCDHNRGPVGVEALAMALDWCEYLEPHARRMYAPATDNGIGAAHLLLKRRDELPEQFTQRDVYRKCWAGLDVDSVKGAVDVLVEYGHLFEFTTDTGGRPSAIYAWRPAA